MVKPLNKMLPALALISTVALGCAAHQREQQPKDKASKTLMQVFGIPIRKTTVKLISRVEKLYDKSLCVTSFQEKEKCGTLTDETIKESLGAATVSSEGAPVVLLDETGRNESTLVHELFHLKLKAEGYPTLEYHIDKTLNADLINLVIIMVASALEHRVFYTEMRKMGLDPDQLERAELDDTILNNNESAVVSEVQIANRAAGYFRTAMECGDGCEKEHTLKKLSEWYERRSWLASLSMAREMIKIVYQNKPSTPEPVINTAFQCVAELLKGRVVVTPMEWRMRQKGKFTEKIAPFHAASPK